MSFSFNFEKESFASFYLFSNKLICNRNSFLQWRNFSCWIVKFWNYLFVLVKNELKWSIFQSSTIYFLWINWKKNWFKKVSSNLCFLRQYFEKCLSKFRLWNDNLLIISGNCWYPKLCWLPSIPIQQTTNFENKSINIFFKIYKNIFRDNWFLARITCKSVWFLEMKFWESWIFFLKIIKIFLDIPLGFINKICRLFYYIQMHFLQFSLKTEKWCGICSYWGSSLLQQCVSYSNFTIFLNIWKIFFNHRIWMFFYCLHIFLPLCFKPFKKLTNQPFANIWEIRWKSLEKKMWYNHFLN